MNTPSPSRRKFLQSLGLVAGAIATSGLSSAKETSASVSASSLTPAKPLTPSRASGAIYMGDFKAPKIAGKVKFAFIGVGDRGTSHVGRMCLLTDDVEIVGIADLYDDFAERSIKEVQKKMNNTPKKYIGPDAYKTMLSECKPDAVIISTNWEGHAQQVIDSMNAGAHAFVEVPLAITTEDMWRIIDVSEKTRKHCMMLENCNYGREELCYLNMVNQGLIGDLLHGEAAYIHELRFQMKDHEVRGTGKWRTPQWAKRNGNLYPTHGLGPVSQYMNLGRSEDTFASLVSYSSPALGRAQYAKKNFPADHEWNKLEYKGGDINTSIIKTLVGRTIMVQWDECSPRPYSRHNLIQGTLGTLAGYPTRVAGENFNGGNYHEWIEGKERLEAEIYAKYDHPLWKRLGAKATKAGGHGGMDFVMLCRVVECLKNGEPMDQNVYEGAFWSVVGPLSEASVAQGGMPQQFPDFTRGDWKKTNKMPIVG